nr:SAM-dependent methyltransferase [Frankia sp. KB5]
MPTAPNLHEVAPESRILYVDNEPSTPWTHTPARPRRCRTLSAVR